MDAIKPIRTPEDHQAALKELERLWDVEEGTAEADRFEVLATLVDAYEKAHFPIPAPDPIEAIVFRMEQQGLTNNDLLPVFKTRARVSEVLNRRRRLNITMVRKLNVMLKIPAEALIADYKLNAG